MKYQDFQVDGMTAMLMVATGFAENVGGHLELTEKGSAWLNAWMVERYPKAMIAMAWPMRHQHQGLRVLLRNLIRLSKLQAKSGSGSPASDSPSPSA
jgi:hypothetical protein